jgi:hypothetical protein
MRAAGFQIGRTIGVAIILSMALSAVAVRAEGESGPPCSATVKDHCMEGASGGMARMRHRHAVHHKHHMAMAKPAAPAPAKPAPAAPAKPKAK